MKIKNSLYKILISIIFALAIIFVSNNVEANSINDLQMDIYIDKNGNAEITEKWKVDADSGTEFYHPYYNLGKTEISNLSVTFNNTTFENIDQWNTKASFSQKGYKCGINKVSNGLELCFGLSKYGKDNIYTMKYTMSNFIAQLTDSQMIYWTFVPYDFSNKIASANITIHTDSYINDNIDVWGYGCKGALCYVADGKIHMAAQNLKSSEYMTILVKFPDDTFTTDNELDYNFEHYLNMAEKGADHYQKEEILYTIIGIISTLFPFIIIIFSVILSNMMNNAKSFDYTIGGKKIPRDVPYYRDIPLNGDLFEAYYLLDIYKMVPSNKSNIIGAIFLKWLKEKKIEFNKNEKGSLIKKNEYSITLNYMGQFDNDIEKRLYDFVNKASKDGILENKEFEKWSKTNYSKIEDWFDDIKEEGKKRLIKKGLVKEIEKSFLFIKNTVPAADNGLKEEVLKLAGLKRYLKDYTLIKDRTAPEVELFEKYLMFAQIFGIADEVSKEFKELYPDLIKQTEYGAYDYIIYSNIYSNRIHSTVSKALADARSYSSGGGGFSSGGGGGGSFGGGGGRRRFPLKYKYL